MIHTPFTILTESGHRYHRLKGWFLRIGGKIICRKVYGPMSVYHSLIRGLEELKILSYNINPPTSQIHETVIVLIGKDTLTYALDLKKKSKIKKILAGPAISVPINNHDIFFHSDIDTILVPSQRVKDYFCSLCIEKSERIKIRPAGVADTGLSKKSGQHIIIYKKTCPDELYRNICSLLDKKGILYHTLIYGSFKFTEYQKLLDTAIAMIYIQESESQGIALQEAWIKDIPTIVRDRGYRIHQDKKRESSNISCPWLTNACGMTFQRGNQEEKLDIFLTNVTSYTPRNYCLKKLSDSISTKKILSLL